MIPGCYDPKARVADMDIDGVQAALCFPSFPRFAGTVFLEGKDKELALLCVQAWNDFQLDEWCAAAPDRFIPMIMLPLWDPTAMRRPRSTASRPRAPRRSLPGEPGTARPAVVPHRPLGPGVLRRRGDRTAAVHALRLLGACRPSPRPEAPMAVMITLFGTNSMYATADLLFSPVFHSHPEPEGAFSEGGIGWMPYLLERMRLRVEQAPLLPERQPGGPPVGAVPPTYLAASSTTRSA